MKIGVISRSAGFHASANVCGSIPGAEYVHWHNWRKLVNYDAIYIVGWYVGSPQARQEHEAIVALGKPTIIHWAGSDVLILNQYVHDIGDQDALDILNSAKNVRMFAQTDKLKKEVFDLIVYFGNDITVCPISTRLDIDVMPIEKKFNGEVDPKVSLYIPPGRRDFFHFNTIHEVTTKMEDVIFIATSFSSNVGDRQLTENFVDWGKLGDKGMMQLMSICNIHLRLVEHDGFSLSVIENCLAGRYVITNQDYPHTMKVEPTVDAVVEAINKVKEIKEPNRDAAEFYKANYGKEQYAQKVMEAFDGIN